MGYPQDGLTIESIMVAAHATATEKGWRGEHDNRTFGDEIALMHSELSEALEEFRDPDSEIDGIYHTAINPEKPEGVAVELADVIIRIAESCKERNIPLVEALRQKMAYNATRPFRHGGKAL